MNNRLTRYASSASKSPQVRNGAGSLSNTRYSETSGRRVNSQLSGNAVTWATIIGVCTLSLSLNELSKAADANPMAQPVDTIDEVDVTTHRQTALDAEAMSLSDTPDAEPSVSGKTTIVVGLGARDQPVYDGSNKTKVAPLPYVDIHGLFHDRIFISDIRGLGVNLLADGAFKVGTSFNYGNGRTSSDSPRLNGLPDIKDSVTVAGFMTYSIKPFAFELKVEREFGSMPATELSARATYAIAPSPRWHVTFGSQLTWHDSEYNQKFYGVTAAQAAEATDVGNPLTAYTAKSGLGAIGVTGTSVYALSEHWGVVTRLGFRDIIGSSIKDSPLTQKTTAMDFAVGAAYKF